MPPATSASEPEAGVDGHYIGVDVGATKVAVATLEDELLSEPSLRPTNAESTDGLIDEVVAAVDAVRTSRTRAVGVGVPSIVEFDTGRVRSSVNLNLADFDLRGVLEDRIEVPVFVDNDATVAAIGEAFDDAGRVTVQNLVMFTVGTGVGGGLVLGGRVYRGSTGAAGELGHTLVGATFGEGPARRGAVSATGLARVPRRPAACSIASARTSPPSGATPLWAGWPRGETTSTGVTSSARPTRAIRTPCAPSASSASDWESGLRTPSTRSIRTRL